MKNFKKVFFLATLTLLMASILNYAFGFNIYATSAVLLVVSQIPTPDAVLLMGVQTVGQRIIFENAKKTLTEFRQEFAAIDATIIFNTPNYKVWVGNFRTRIEAEKTLSEINNRYKNVLLIKPSR